jgi:menaquinone-dependent protoporphyrinogen oxidase
MHLKTVVLYDSKRGVTEECALKISENLKCDNYNLRKNSNIDLNNYDLIIIGTPLYAGMPMSSVKKFCNNNKILKTKKLAFFLCGIGNADEMINTFKKQLNSDIVNNISIIRHFGGELRPDRAHFIMKAIMTKMLEDPKFKSNIKEDEIKKFIKEVGEIE